MSTDTPTAPRAGLWWRITAMALVSFVGLVSAVGFVVAWAFMGWKGSVVEPWEPVAWPLGVAASVLVPMVAGRWLLGRPGKGYWLVAAGVGATVLVVLVLLGQAMGVGG